MENKLRVAIVGCGRMAGFIDEEVKDYPAIKLPYSHAAAYTKCKDTQLIAACATTKESVSRFCKKWNIPKGYIDYKEMIIKEKPDILSITTHADMHAPIIIFAAQNRVKGIYCEKPIATSLSEADKAIEECNKCSVKLMIGHNRRWHSGYLNAKEFISQGYLGKLIAINTIHTGELFHTGTHNFDLINMFANSKALFVQATLDNIKPKTVKLKIFKNDFSGVGFIRYKNGITAFIHGRFSSPALFNQEFICEKGYIRFFNNGSNCEVWKLEEVSRPFALKDIVWKNRPNITVEKKLKTPFSIELNSTTLSAIRDLINAIRNDTETLSSGENARDALELGMAFIQSEIEKGKRIYLPLKARNIVVNAR